MTIFGQHTFAELKELIAAKDYEHTQIQAAYDAKPAIVNAADPKWSNDWQAFLARYKSARLVCLAEIATAGATTLGASLSVTPAEKQWQTLLHTLTQDPSKPYTDLDEQGLFVRLQKAGVQPDVSHVPQPTSADIDLGVYKGADDLLKGGAAVVAAATDAGKKSVSSHPLLYVFGGLAAVGVGYVALRAVIPPNPFRRR